VTVANVIDTLHERLLPLLRLFVVRRRLLSKETFGFASTKPVLHLLGHVDLCRCVVRIDGNEIVFVDNEIVLRLVNNLNIVRRRRVTIVIRPLLSVPLKNDGIPRRAEVTQTRERCARAAHVSAQQIHCSTMSREREHARLTTITRMSRLSADKESLGMNVSRLLDNETNERRINVDNSWKDKCRINGHIVRQVRVFYWRERRDMNGQVADDTTQCNSGQLSAVYNELIVRSAIDANKTRFIYQCTNTQNIQSDSRTRTARRRCHPMTSEQRTVPSVSHIGLVVFRIGADGQWPSFC
jgi:hypothetical protein